MDFPFEYKDEKFTVTIPFRRLDVDPNVNDIAEEIGRLYGYNNLVSTLPICGDKKGGYALDVKYRKLISKRLRSLGLNECKTYTLVSPSMADMFKYDNKANIVLPNPLSTDKSVVRTSLIPSLINVYDYNKSRGVNDIMIYEIAKTYDVNYEEDSKIAILMKGNYIINNWNSVKMQTDFYLIKGIVENVLDYLGFKNRYSFEKKEIDDMHPGICASIMLDRNPIGIIGKVHPSFKKDDIYVAEISLNALMGKVKPIKFKASSKYPLIKKDVAFIVDKNISSLDISNVIKKAGGRLLTDIDVFDVYTGDKIDSSKKSIAYSLTFSSNDRTLSEDEVMKIFNNIIDKCESELNAHLRDK